MSTLAVTLTVDQMRELVSDAVTAAVGEVTHEPLPALVTKSQLARALGVSVGTVDKLRGEGMPTVFVSDSPRFEVSAALEWLKQKRESRDG